MVVQPALAVTSIRVPFDIVIGTAPISSVQHVIATTTEDASVSLAVKPSVMLNKTQLLRKFSDCNVIQHIVLYSALYGPLSLPIT
jgi:hypothetical protein